MKALDLSGTRFGRLIAVEDVGRCKDRHHLWRCVCDCGNEAIVSSNQLRRGNTRSCGCLMFDTNTKHGQHKTRLYKTWANMVARCTTPSASNYECYGGRGITVCEEWRSFKPFYEWAVLNGYQSNLTIDRIDVNGNYCPENCRWATAKEQANNTRRSHYLTFNGETHTITEWSKITGLSPGCIRGRLGVCGWSVGDALTKPAQERRKIF